jgi:hypothetical protein
MTQKPLHLVALALDPDRGTLTALDPTLDPDLSCFTHSLAHHLLALKHLLLLLGSQNAPHLATQFG